MKTKKLYFITQAAMIAAIYIVMTMFINTFNLASGTIQIRISEALTVLPFFTPAAVPGLFIGCLLSNLLTGAMLPDVIFGKLCIEKTFFSCDPAAGYCQYGDHTICSPLCVWYDICGSRCGYIYSVSGINSGSR